MAILMAAREGDPGAVDRFLARVRPLLLKRVRRQIGHGWAQSWAEDIAQDVLILLYEHYPSSHASTDAALGAWLRVIIRRQVAAFLRSDPPTVAIDLTYCEAPPPPCVEAPSRELAALERAHATLSNDHAHLLWMRLMNRAPWREIAAELGTTPAGAKRRYQRICNRLRRMILADR